MSLSTELLNLLISSSASCAGVAAAAGKVAKHVKYLAVMEMTGGDFIPLVVKYVFCGSELDRK